jgi:RNA polymerase sigma-70 factor, ECF subfamily
MESDTTCVANDTMTIIPTISIKILDKISDGKITPMRWLDKLKRASLTPEQLQERYLLTILAYTTRRLPCLADAEDATAETFGAAFSIFARCPNTTTSPTETDDDPVRAWLIGIARRKVADILRRRTRKPEASWESLNRETSDERHLEPEVQFLENERKYEIHQALAALPDEYEEILLLKYGDELKTKEIATILGKSEAATNSLLQRARLSLEKVIVEREKEINK